MSTAPDLNLGPVSRVKGCICPAADPLPMSSAWARVPSPAPAVGTTERRGGWILGKVLQVYLWVFLPCDNVPKFIFVVVWMPHLVFSKFAPRSQSKGSACLHPVPGQARVARTRELTASLHGDLQALVCRGACRAPCGKLWWGLQGLVTHRHHPGSFSVPPMCRCHPLRCGEETACSVGLASLSFCCFCEATRL